MQERILTSLGIPDAQVFVRGVDRPNIALLRWTVAADGRAQAVAQLCRLRMPGGGKVMIFVPTLKVGQALQNYLGEQGLETPFYYSRLGDAWDREQLLKRFVGDSRPEVDRIICTSAFGMGLDVPNVRMVTRQVDSDHELAHRRVDVPDEAVGTTATSRPPAKSSPRSPGFRRRLSTRPIRI